MKTIKIVLALLVIACCMYVDYENEYYMLIRDIGAFVFFMPGMYMIIKESRKRTLAGVLVGLGFLFQPYSMFFVMMVLVGLEFLLHIEVSELLASVLWYVIVIAMTIWLIVLMIRDR